MPDHVTQAPGGCSPSAAIPIYSVLFPVSIVCFVAALASDVAYFTSAFLMWRNDSEWLIAIGLVFGALEALVLLIGFVARRSVRRGRFGWLHFTLLLATLAAELPT